MKAYRKRSFTLVEMLVSIGLLSLMMMFMLRFFNGAQQLWRSDDRSAALRQNARGALDMIWDLATTVQFTPGEKTVAGVPKRDRTMDSLFSLDTQNTNDYGDAHKLFFACKTASELPKKANDIRFVSFQLGDPGSDYARGKLFMLVYSDKRDEDKFYSLFPRYDSAPAQGNRNHALASLKSWMALPGSEAEENEYAQVIAENVVGFRIDAFALANSGTPVQVVGNDIGEVPYILRIRLTQLDSEDFAVFTTLDSSGRADFLTKKAYTSTRDIFIGDRWALEKSRLAD